MIKKNVPNLITLCNLVCGLLAIVWTFGGKMEWAVYAVITGSLFDFLDGMIARLLHVHSALGKDLDSLSDLVTFGVAPGCMIFQILQQSEVINYVQYTAMAIPVFSAWRLAKFNNDPRQTKDFIGLPTPANALFFISIALLYTTHATEPISIIWINPIFITVSIGVMCGLMVSEIKLFSLKITQFPTLTAYRFPFVFFILSNILFFAYLFAAIPIIIVLYVVLSIIKNLSSK